MEKLLKNLQELNWMARWLLLIQFAFYVGSFLVVPFLAIYLNRKLGFSMAFVGVQLTIKLFTQRGLMLAGGIISDRIGATRAIGIAIVIRALSFLLYLAGSNVISISLASAIFGFGGAVFIPASKAALTMAVNSPSKQLIFSLRSVANNLGMAAGGLIGAVLIDMNPTIVFVSAAALQMLSGALLFHPQFKKLQTDFIAEKNTHSARRSIATTVAAILRKPNVIVMALMYCGFTAICAQFEFTLPLAAAALFNNQAVGLMFFVNTVMVFICQIPLNHLLAERMSSGKILTFGFLCIAIAMTGFALPQSLGQFLLLTAVFTVGEIAIDPSIDALSSSQVDRAELGTLFGIFGAVALIGGSLGNLIGSYFFEAPAGGFLWLLCGAIAVLAMALGVYYERSQSRAMAISREGEC